jgi:hypothetical protein
MVTVVDYIYLKEGAISALEESCLRRKKKVK